MNESKAVEEAVDSGVAFLDNLWAERHGFTVSGTDPEGSFTALQRAWETRILARLDMP